MKVWNIMSINKDDEAFMTKNPEGCNEAYDTTRLL
jgi:hypothetical protein